MPAGSPTSFGRMGSGSFTSSNPKWKWWYGPRPGIDRVTCPSRPSPRWTTAARKFAASSFGVLSRPCCRLVSKRPACLEAANPLAVAEALHEMVVHHSRGLHEGVTDGGPDEGEACLSQSGGHGSAFLGLGRDLPSRPTVIHPRLAIDEAPQVAGDTACPFPHREIAPRVTDASFEFGAVSNNTLVGHQPLDARRAPTGDAFRVKPVEGPSEVLALSQDGDPRKASLKAVQEQLLKEGAVIPLRHPPLRVVVGEVQGVFPRPGAAMQCFRSHRIRLAQPFAPCRR